MTAAPDGLGFMAGRYLDLVRRHAAAVARAEQAEDRIAAALEACDDVEENHYGANCNDIREALGALDGADAAT